MTLKIGDTAPDFEADSTEGRIHFHDWVGDSWAVLFSHPKDFTPVCTTELGYMARIKPEFDRRNVKIIGLSVDTTSDHEGWAKDIEETQGEAPNYPIIGDADFEVSKLYGMLPAETSGDPGDRTPMDNQTVRNVFVVGPDKKVKLILIYPMTTGRNFDEVLRVIDSLQLTANHKVATPVNWRQGEDVIIAGSVSDDEAKEIFGEWDAPKPYIRVVPQPEQESAAVGDDLGECDEGQPAAEAVPRRLSDGRRAPRRARGRHRRLLRPAERRRGDPHGRVGAEGARRLLRALAPDPRRRRAGREDDRLRGRGRGQHHELEPGREAPRRLLARPRVLGAGARDPGAARSSSTSWNGRSTRRSRRRTSARSGCSRSAGSRSSAAKPSRTRRSGRSSSS